MQDKKNTMAKLPYEEQELRDDRILKQTKEDIENQLQFEKLISRLSAEFINLPFDQIDQKIDDGLSGHAEVIFQAAITCFRRGKERIETRGPKQNYKLGAIQ